MTRFVTRIQRRYTLLELAVVATIFAILLTLLLHRIRYYQAEAERAAVHMTVANLRTALQLRVAEAKLRQDDAYLTMLTEENPFSWLKSKPVNYAGEYYTPTDSDIGAGNWYFDRTDKTVGYLLNFPENFLDARMQRVKFKVKLLHLLNTSGIAGNATDPVAGVSFEQVKD